MLFPNLKTVLYAALPLLGLSGFLTTGCATEVTDHQDEHVGVADQALTAAQCNYFAVNGKVQICHRTPSAAHPYSVLKVSEQACVNAHALHAGDYVAVNDPTCQGGGCLPQGAPCDPTLPCCDGFSCQNGTCTQNVTDHCDPSPCQNAGSCVNDSNGYTCTCPAGFIGTNCEIEIDECVGNPCAHGACLDGINAYVCECNPGWIGTNCDIDIDECAANPCVHGQCTDEVNAYTCECDSGWTGTNCDEPAGVTCPCIANDPDFASILANPSGWCGTVSTGGTIGGLNTSGNSDVAAVSHYDNTGETVCFAQSNFFATHVVTVLTPEQVTACLAAIDAAGASIGLDCRNNCEPNPCQHGGTCTDGIDSYTCSCPEGTSGPTCNGYNCTTDNPCTEENMNNGQFYFQSQSGPGNFIQCNEWGGCFDQSCPSGQSWNQATLTCETVTCPCEPALSTVLSVVLQDPGAMCLQDESVMQIIAVDQATMSPWGVSVGVDSSTNANTCMAFTADFSTFAYATDISNAELAACRAITPASCP